MQQRLIVLGAGTALPDRDRDNTFLVWESPAGSWLIDCGGRPYQQLLRAGVDPMHLHGALLTHNHPDHIYGVPALLFQLWLAGYTGTFQIHANPSTLPMARRLCEALELEQHGHMCATDWHELPETAGYVVSDNDQFQLSITPVVHSRPTIAVKIVDRQAGATIVYSSDTEPCPQLESFARGAHTLIHEATISSPEPRHNHTMPGEAGAIARRCGVQRLVLIHYSAEYTMPESDAIAQVRAAGFEGDVELARELAAYSVEG